MMWFRKRNRRQASRTETPVAAWVAFVSRQRRRLSMAGGCLLAALLLFWSVLALLDRPVRHVEVTGHFLRVSAPQIEQTVLAYSRTGARDGRGFVSLDLHGLQGALQTIPWVDRARVERRWPDGVRVTIIEQTPGARWGERGLLNARGELFLKEARFIPAELPQLNGPEGTEEQVARLYLDTFPRLAVVGLRLARVTLDPRGAWELMVTSTQASGNNNGGVVVRLGRQDVNERLERFIVAASPLIATRSGELTYVDMRYSNGFAVGWTRGAASLANKPSAKGATPDA